MCEFIAVKEWEAYNRRLNPRGQVAFVLNDDASLGADGYLLAKEGDGIQVSAPTERGLVYGCYALIDACRQAGNRFVMVTGREVPHFPLRMLWSWSRIEGTHRHSPYMRVPSAFTREAMADPESSKEMMRFIRHMASMRVNALALNHELHHGDLKVYDQHGFRPYYRELGAFAEYLKHWGVELYLYTAAAPEKDFCKNVADTDCSFDPKVEAFWHETVKEICENVPGIGGLLIAGGLGGYAGGRLNECDCIYCQGKTLVEKAHKQVQTIAGELEGFGKKLVYTVTTDIPFTLDREVDVTLALMDKVPQNTLITFKNCFHDYEELRYPEHPLLDHFPRSGQLPIAVEMQLFPEMRGKGLILSNTTDIWCAQFDHLRRIGAQGVIGVIETHPDDAHPSMAEWHAWGRLAWYSIRRPRELLAQFARMEYPEGTEQILPDILLQAYTAASYTIYAGGMQCGIHGMICPFPHYIKHKVNDTWCRKDHPLPHGVIGVHDEPFDLFTPRLKREIATNPRLFLLNRAQQVTQEVFDRLMAEKDAAIALYQAMLAQWQIAAALFEKEDYRYQSLLDMLNKNVSDAKRFKAMFQVFLLWQMNRLAVADIAKVREEHICKGVNCSINTCDDLLDAALERYEKLIENVPFDTHFDNMSDLPQLDMACWQDGMLMNLKG